MPQTFCFNDCKYHVSTSIGKKEVTKSNNSCPLWESPQDVVIGGE